MSVKGTVEHRGIVDHCDKDSVHVKILSQSACASCKLNGVCGMDTKAKVIEVDNCSASEFSSGDEVNVGISEKLGYKALFFGYLLPFIIVLIVLLVSMGISGNEGLSGVLALSSLLPYYITLSLLRDKLKKSFRFSINKK